MCGYNYFSFVCICSMLETLVGKLVSNLMYIFECLLDFFFLELLSKFGVTSMDGG